MTRRTCLIKPATVSPGRILKLTTARAKVGITLSLGSVRCSSNSPVMLAGLGHALGVSRDRRGALKVVGQLNQLRGRKGLFAYEIGIVHAVLGDLDDAFKWLTRAVQERSGWIAYLSVEPRLDAIRNDPRFKKLVIN